MATQQYNDILQDFHQYPQRDSLFISFEGIEGSGKSTQIKLLSEYFEQNGHQVITFREPGGTKFGEGLREAILQSDTPLHPMAEAHLFASSRAQLLHQEIIPRLKQKKQIILLDRYLDSSLAYQGMARGLGVSTILKLHQDAPLNLLPHLTFYLKISLETSMERQTIRNNKKDYFEQENHDFYLKLIEGYDHCAEVFPQRIKTIDASTSVEEIQKQIIETIKKL